MITAFKKWAKWVSPIALSKNHRYDILCQKIIKNYCRADSNCIDVGAHHGEILDLFLKYCPEGIHFAFEPIPVLHRKLIQRYKKYPSCRIYNYAVSSISGSTTFNHVISNPAYSGIKKRNYDRKNETDETLIVAQTSLDDIVPEDTMIDFIKIDVEGGEFDVLRGAKRLIQQSRPLLVFEFGIGGSDIYGVTPRIMMSFLQDAGYSVSLLDSFLTNKPVLSSEEFNIQFYQKVNYYFIAHPADRKSEIRK